MEWEKEFHIAQKAALKAGNQLEKLSRSNIIDSSGRDVKHQSDIESEKIIIDIIEKESVFPILAEESGARGFSSKKSPLWIIDPLDGTLNYSQCINFCCVSIALWQCDKPILGVINDFNHGELFSGIVGQSAWCNDIEIKPSKEKTPQQAVLATGFPVNRDFSSEGIVAFMQRIQQFKKIRLLGSAALSLAYVACDRVDAYTEEDIMLWDVAAGIAIVKAAGGAVQFQKSDRKKWRMDVWAGKVFEE